MQRKCSMIVILLAAILAVLMVCFSTYAQDADFSDMTNEQLMALLQAIMQKLQEEETARPAETSEVPETSAKPAAEAVTGTEPEEVAESEPYHIYENKKMLREKLPDSYFVKPEKHSKDEDKPDKHKKKEEDHSCPPGREWNCDSLGHCGCFWG